MNQTNSFTTMATTLTLENAAASNVKQVTRYHSLLPGSTVGSTSRFIRNLYDINEILKNTAEPLLRYNHNVQIKTQIFI